MKRFSLLAAVVCLVIGSVIAGDAVQPATLTFTNFRDTASIPQPTTTEYYQGTSIRLTNCVMYAGADTNSSPQGLNDVDISVSMGNESSATDYTGYASDASNGVYYCNGTVPSGMDWFYIEVTITDANTNSYTYQWQKVLTRDPL